MVLQQCRDAMASWLPISAACQRRTLLTDADGAELGRVGGLDKRSSDERIADHRQAVSVAGRIRDYWKQLGLDVRVEVLPDGSIRSDMIGGWPVRRVERL